CEAAFTLVSHIAEGSRRAKQVAVSWEELMQSDELGLPRELVHAVENLHNAVGRNDQRLATAIQPKFASLKSSLDVIQKLLLEHYVKAHLALREQHLKSQMVQLEAVRQSSAMAAKVHLLDIAHTLEAFVRAHQDSIRSAVDPEIPSLRQRAHNEIVQ